MLRSCEWILTVYFTYATACAWVLKPHTPVAFVAAGLNLLVVCGFGLLAWGEALRGRPLLRVLRDWYPLPLMLLAYREMGWLAPASHTYQLEQKWVLWDKALLNRFKLAEAIEALGPVVPSILELSYTLVYTIAPFCMGWLYYRRLQARMNAFLTSYLTAIFCCYALFPFFPSEPPRTVFPNEDLPQVDTVFRQFNLALLGQYGIHTSVFPSAHVAGSFAGAFAMRELLPQQRWVWRLLAALASSIAVATIYGRYHYTVDAVAGFLAALGGWVVARRMARAAA